MSAVPRQVDPCPYPAHRETDWRLPDGPQWVCGRCHPPPFQEVQVAASGRHDAEVLSVAIERRSSDD